MLTKDLLKYSSRGDRVYPKYLSMKEGDFQKMAADLDKIYSASVGQRLQDLEDQLKSYSKKQDIVFQGFRKLLDERCEFNEQEETVEEQRWQWFLRAGALRKAGNLDIPSFQSAISRELRLPFDTIAEGLYGDLPDCRTISGYRSCAPEALVHRYNAAQIQGLLLRAQRIRMTVRDASVLKRRRFLQRLKFWRLMAEFEEKDGELSLEISGPLAIFEANQTYGMRLCNFFPCLLLMDKWSIDADIKMGDKFLSLQVDSSRPIQSHYKDFTGHIPQEFKALIEAFNGLDVSARKAWTAAEAQEAINLGQQVYCVPDMSFHKEGVPVIHLELFHKWHGKQLQKRLDSVTKDLRLLIGISQELVKEKEIESTVAKLQGDGVKIFLFRKFPTPKAILTYLS